MENLQIRQTPSTPKVDFDHLTGKLFIEGRAIPENPGDFFKIIVDWLESYFQTPAAKTQLVVNLEYVNSGSSKYLLSVFKVLRTAWKKGIDIEVFWLYEEDDEAIEGLGEHYQTSVGVPFVLKEYI